jgi:hypothetical protein
MNNLRHLISIEGKRAASYLHVVLLQIAVDACEQCHTLALGERSGASVVL